jgi:hypothetical protein
MSEKKYYLIADTFRQFFFETFQPATGYEGKHEPEMPGKNPVAVSRV